VFHPTDFLGKEDLQGLEFIPEMGLPVSDKLAFVCEVIERITNRRFVLTLRDHANANHSKSSGGHMDSRTLNILVPPLGQTAF
jgi:hypothetical protein